MNQPWMHRPRRDAALLSTACVAPVLPHPTAMPPRPGHAHAGRSAHLASFMDHLALSEAGQRTLVGLSMRTQLRQLMWRSLALGDGLRHHLGVQAGDRVLLCVDDDLTLCLLLWALAREGVWCVCVPRTRCDATWQALALSVRPRAWVGAGALLPAAKGLARMGCALWTDDDLLEATFRRRLGAWYPMRTAPPVSSAVDGVLGLHLVPDEAGPWWPMVITHRNVLASLGQCEAALGTRTALHTQSLWWQGLLGRGMQWPWPGHLPHRPVAWTPRRAPWWTPTRVGLPVACRVSPHAGSAWRALPATDLRILGPASEGASVGEVCVKGPQVPAQVWNAPQANAHLYTVEGHLRTGVMGRIDAQGLLHLMEAGTPRPSVNEGRSMSGFECDVFT